MVAGEYVGVHDGAGGYDSAEGIQTLIVVGFIFLAGSFGGIGFVRT